jgi:hypothetical protein
MSSATVDALLTPLSTPRPDLSQEAPFSTIEQGIALIDSTGPESRSSRRLRREVEWLVAQQRALEALSARWLAEIDRLDEVRRQEQVVPDDPFLLAPCRWLQDALNVTSNAAYAQIHTARQLRHLNRTAAALRRGEIGSQQVSVICRATEESRKTSLELSDVEAELVDAARRMDHVELRRHWCQMRYQADQAAAEEAEEEQRRRRWVRFWKTPFDTYRIEGELDPESGAVLKTAFKAMLARGPKDDERTADERRADVLMEMGRRCLDAGELPERGGERRHLTVVAELSTLRLEPGSAMARLDWGPLLTGAAARRIAEDAEITPVLVDSKGDVLHVGRRSRSVTTRQRKALNLRDGHCRSPGCDVPADQCVPHHARHWADGGPTDLTNLTLYCEVHHARLHPENARFGRKPSESGSGVSRAP